MAKNDEKKYYWLKFPDDFFKRHDIKIIENMPNGKDYVIFYLKLMCESVSHEGLLRFSDEIPYNADMLATITGTNIDIVKSAIDLLRQLKLVEILDDETLYLRQVEKLIGVESGMAKRLREYRQNKQIEFEDIKQLELPKEIKKKEKKKEKKKQEFKKYGEYQNVLLTNEQYEKLKNEFPFDYEERIQNCDNYCQSFGKKYEDYLATIRNWSKREKNKSNYNNSRLKQEAVPVYDNSKNPEITFNQEEFDKIMKERRIEND